MVIIEATKDDFAVLAGMIENHPEPSYDCSCSFYQASVFNMLSMPHIKVWIAFEDRRAIGYLIGVMDISGLYNQVYVFDICISDGSRNGTVSKELLKVGKEWARSLMVKRVVWNSKISAKAWGRMTNNNIYEEHHCVMEV